MAKSLETVMTRPLGGKHHCFFEGRGHYSGVAFRCHFALQLLLSI
jgi:hypothetical protein